MARRLPPLNAFRSFEAAARHGSFARAAEELCVTPGAVSHQVRSLEATLGIRLFHRSGGGLALTRQGDDYLEVARDALDRIAIGTDRLLGRGPPLLTISASPDFVARWLVRRIGRFATLHPAIPLRIQAQAEHADFAADGVDVAIRHGGGRWPGLVALPLGPERVFPVCSPAFLDLRGGIAVADLPRLPLLRLEGSSAWEAWFLAARVPGPVPPGTTLNRASLVIDAAVEGHGLALARTTLVVEEMIRGRLVRPLPGSIAPACTYWVVRPAAGAAPARVDAFQDWLLAESEEDRKRLAVMGGD
jgi:LysR family glycine cleavage system transcriptional activator